MANQNNAAYWAQRMKNMEEALLDKSYAYVENLEKQFTTAQTEIEKMIAVWYQRLADNNEMSFADAKRLLNKDELAEFHWTVGEYIAYGQQNALDGRWMKQLENASAKVHISRLESLKLQLQQQAEALYSNQLDALDDATRRIYEGSYYHTAFEIQRGLGVGWTMHAINEGVISKVLSRPWTVDNQTFRDRCWANKESLVNAVNTQLTQMIIRGEAPDRTIAAIAKQFGVSKGKAGRLVMTESAYFASAAQRDCFTALDVERYVWVSALDGHTCDICGAMDGKVFRMSEFSVGITAPPAHPWCRCCTAPYFEDMQGLGARFARKDDGTIGTVPRDMTFAEWKRRFVQDDSLTSFRFGATLTDRKLSENEGADVHTVGHIDIDKYRCVTDDIVTDEVIITNERIEHIKERHPGDYERYIGYMEEIVGDPDYIVEANKNNTAVILKTINDPDDKFKLILRLKIQEDPANFKNSVLSFWRIGDTTWKKILKNKKILYSRE